MARKLTIEILISDQTEGDDDTVLKGVKEHVELCTPNALDVKIINIEKV